MIKPMVGTPKSNKWREGAVKKQLKSNIIKLNKDQSSIWYTREDIMKQWDRWREYIANGGEGSWPRDAFESLLDYFEEKINKKL